jgi:hypothetical protein
LAAWVAAGNHAARPSTKAGHISGIPRRRGAVDGALKHGFKEARQH